jgi:hypothetical protein
LYTAIRDKGELRKMRVSITGQVLLRSFLFIRFFEKSLGYLEMKIAGKILSPGVGASEEAVKGVKSSLLTN